MSVEIEDKAHAPEDLTWGLRRADGNYMHVNPDGTRYNRHCKDGWTIRNVAPTPTPDERAVAPELVARMVEHLKDCGQAHNIQPRDPDAQRRYDEMKAILAALEPVDRVEARRLAGIWEIDEEAAYQILARGRQLEKEGK